MANHPDVAPFARVITCDAQRVDGAKGNRLKEFAEPGLQLDPDVLASAAGDFTVPVFADGRGVIGLLSPPGQPTCEPLPQAEKSDFSAGLSVRG